GGGPGSRWSARLDERPGGRTFSWLTLDQGRERLSGMWVGGPQAQVISLAGTRLRSSLRGCPRLVAAGAWGGFAGGAAGASRPGGRPPVAGASKTRDDALPACRPSHAAFLAGGARARARASPVG